MKKLYQMSVGLVVIAFVATSALAADNDLLNAGRAKKELGPSLQSATAAIQAAGLSWNPSDPAQWKIAKQALSNGKSQAAFYTSRVDPKVKPITQKSQLDLAIAQLEMRVNGDVPTAFSAWKLDSDTVFSTSYPVPVTRAALQSGNLMRPRLQSLSGDQLIDAVKNIRDPEVKAVAIGEGAERLVSSATTLTFKERADIVQRLVGASPPADMSVSLLDGVYFAGGQKASTMTAFTQFSPAGVQFSGAAQGSAKGIGVSSLAQGALDGVLSARPRALFVSAPRVSADCRQVGTDTKMSRRAAGQAPAPNPQINQLNNQIAATESAALSADARAQTAQNQIYVAQQELARAQSQAAQAKAQAQSNQAQTGSGGGWMGALSTGLNSWANAEADNMVRDAQNRVINLTQQAANARSDAANKRAQVGQYKIQQAQAPAVVYVTQYAPYAIAVDVVDCQRTTTRKVYEASADGRFYGPYVDSVVERTTMRVANGIDGGDPDAATIRTQFTAGEVVNQYRGQAGPLDIVRVMQTAYTQQKGASVAPALPVSDAASLSAALFTP